MSEAQEELKRSSEAALRREREQQEVINKLQVRINSLLSVTELTNMCIIIFHRTRGLMAH